MPVVSLDNVTVEEGDRPGTTTARVPFHVRGNLTGRASFTVFVAGERDVLDRGTFTVDLAPGQTEGSIPIGFIADNDRRLRRDSDLSLPHGRAAE